MSRRVGHNASSATVGRELLQWRVAASCVLLTGVLSLVVSLEHQAPGALMDRVPEHRLLNIMVKDQRRHSMAVPDPQGATLDRSRDSATTRSRYSAEMESISPASVTEVRDAVTGYPQAYASYGLRDRLEQLVRQYPWPTLVIGIGLGFVLARRMRS